MASEPLTSRVVDSIARAAEPIAALRRLHARVPLGPSAIERLTNEVPRRGRSNLI
jgi:hypothetical protein